jgi:KUP system potassium uptake protein
MIGRQVWLRGHVTHENVLLLRVVTTGRPYVPDGQRLSIEDLGGGLYRGLASFGFMQRVDISATLSHGLPFEPRSAVFFMPQIIVTPGAEWWRGFWGRCYLFLGRTGLSQIEYFNLPPDQVVSVGIQLEV